MSSPGSITYWIDRLQAQDPLAAEKLWESYFHRLVGLARLKLQDAPRRAADEEDVALSAFDSFCRGAAQGRFPVLRDREDLWRLLVTITVRKAQRLVRDESRQKRGGGAVYDEAALCGAAGAEEHRPSLDEIISREPTPEFAAQVAEEYRRLLNQLADAELRAIAVWKMEGETNEAIAGRLGCAPSTVERRLRLIRQTWEQGVAP